MATRKGERPDPVQQDASEDTDDARFRTVVKRLLDTPPMHKAAKTSGAERRQPRKAKPKAD